MNNFSLATLSLYRQGEVQPRANIRAMAKGILTDFVVRIKGWMFAYCIINTKNPYSLKLAFQNFAPNHTLFRESEFRQISESLTTKYKI